MAFYIYILKCHDGSYYTGHTDNLESRLQQHHQGSIRSCYTFPRRPLILVYSSSFVTREEALNIERKIKGWSRKKKEALIQEDWDLMKSLSTSYSRKV